MRPALIWLLIPLVTLTGCMPSTDAKLLGKWQTPTGGIMEFKTGGIVTMSGPNGSVDVHYRMLDATTIELRMLDGSGRPHQRRIQSLTDQELVLVDEEGPQSLQRVP
jgi:hypothetical protein